MLSLRPSGRRRHAALLLLAIALGACGARHRVFEDHGIYFTYPADWRPIRSSVESRATVGRPLSRDVIGVDETNFVIVSRYRLNAAVDEENFERLRDDIEAAWAEAVEEGGGSIVGSPTSLTMGGLPAIRFDATGPNPDGILVHNTVVLGFLGTTEYFLNCQRTPDAAEEMERGCEQIVRTFQVTAPAPTD